MRMTITRLRCELGWGYHWGCGGKVYIGEYEMCDRCNTYGIAPMDISWNPKNVRFCIEAARKVWTEMRGD